MGSVALTVSVWALPPLRAMVVAAPAVAVAVKVTGLPASPLDVAVRVFAPAAVPSVQLATWATPPAFVVIGVVGSTAPPPEPTANVTDTPATGLPNWSRAITDGGVATAVPATALCPSPPLAARVVAGPAVMPNPALVADVKPAPLALSV